MQSTKTGSRRAWILFCVALLILIAGQVLWTALTGTSPWSSPERAKADRIFWVCLGISLVFSIASPFLANGSTLKKLGLAVVAAAAVAVVWCLGAVVHVLVYGV
jgi:hypothetical protein